MNTMLSTYYPKPMKTVARYVGAAAAERGMSKIKEWLQTAAVLGTKKAVPAETTYSQKPFY